MTVQSVVGVGSSANDGTGDPLRTAFTKINTNFADLYAGRVVDAGVTTDLTDAIAACQTIITASGTCTLILRQHDYTWPAAQVIPLGLNIIGSGWDGTHTATPAVGTKITSVTSVATTIVQNTGAARSTVIQGVYWASPVQIRKQHTTMIGCRTDGLIVGDNGNTCSPYYSQFISHRFEGQSGGAAIELQNFANACYFEGNLFMPPLGRGIYLNSAGTGNTFEVSLDYSNGMSTNYGSVVYANSSAADNDIKFRYWEDAAFTGKYLDGCHINFHHTSSTRNRVFVPSSSEAAIRFYDPGFKNFLNTFRTKENLYSASNNLVWDYSIPDNLMFGNSNFYLPPRTFRRGPLIIQNVVAPCTANAAFSLTSAVVNAAGSGGTDGTYYQSISDANTVTGQDAYAQLTVSGGVLTAVTMLYPGWWKVSPSTSFAITAATNLVGATITLTIGTDDIKTPNGQNAFIIADNQTTTFYQDPSNADWYVFPAAPLSGGTVSVSPGASGNATIAHGHTRAPNWASAHILGDTGGTDIKSTIDIQALDATNITLRFCKSSDNSDVTTGGPYTVRWQMR